MSRYRVLEKEPTDHQRNMGDDHTIFRVWDSVSGRRVPFGNYRTREQPERRAERVEA